LKFVHPLGRSAAYRSASAQERRLTHRTIADAAIDTGDLYRQAWHCAKARMGINVDVAPAGYSRGRRAMAGG